MDPDKEVLTVREFLVNPVEDQCRSVSAGCCDPTSFMVLFHMLYMLSSCHSHASWLKYPYFVKLLYPCGLFKVDSGNVVREGGEINFK